MLQSQEYPTVLANASKVSGGLEKCIRAPGLTITKAAQRMKESRVRLSEGVDGSREMTPNPWRRARAHEELSPIPPLE